MFGEDIIVRTLSTERPFGAKRAVHQYHPRSDHHSKVACWAIAFDLLATSSLLAQHVAEGKVTIGVNYEMTDFRLKRSKVLDLVIARIGRDEDGVRLGLPLAALADAYGIELTKREQEVLDELPQAQTRPVGAVLVALEAKACMTEHRKSLPRFYDELNSAHQTVHGAADQAVAVGLAMVNIADAFLSPTRRGEVTKHTQPVVAAAVVNKARQLPRRSGSSGDGFDALGIMIVDLANDGSPVTLWRKPPAPQPGDGDTYAEMILRTSTAYDFRFSAL